MVKDAGVEEVKRASCVARGRIERSMLFAMEDWNAGCCAVIGSGNSRKWPHTLREGHRDLDGV